MYDTLTNSDDSMRFLSLHLDKYLNWYAHYERTNFWFEKIEMHFYKLTITTWRKSINRYLLCKSEVRFLLHKNVLFVVLLIWVKKKTCRSIFKKYGILTLHSLYIFELCNNYIFNSSCTFDLNEDIHTHNTSQKDHFYLSLSKLNLTKNSVKIK